MKKIVSLLLTAFLPAVLLSASPVDIGLASKVARAFFYERTRTVKSHDLNDITMGAPMVAYYEGAAVYYVFNIYDGGYVAISASDAVYPFLAYSPTGSYGEVEPPPAFVAWMDQYSRQISHAIQNQHRADERITLTWKYYLEAGKEELSAYNGREIAPLLTTTWNQNKFYNEMCPSDPGGPGGHCYAGCVATAMGQLVNYFRWPETGLGSYSYECPPYGTLSANFDSTAYQWDLMETSLMHSNLYIAELLYHLGVSVDMVYGPDGSGMYNHKAAYSLRTYFKYSPETQYVFRDSTSMDWDSLLVSHLDRKIPMYYAGWSVPDINGHAFVCDGYQGENFYHFNWGWGGSYDGYFYTDDLTPGGSLFNLAQELIINAVPDTNLYDYPQYCSGADTLTSLFGTIGDGSGPLYDYGSLADCSWLIMPDDSVDYLSLEFLRFSTSPEDYITVYDGTSESDPVLGTFYGNDPPGTLTSSGSSLFLTFESDEGLSGDGFLAAFSSELPVYCSGSVTLSAAADTISDGSGPWNYHDNSSCIWMITPEDASYVTLTFLDFATEPAYDAVRIYDLDSQELLAEYSGVYDQGVPEPVTSPSGEMFVLFTTNFSVRDAGWSAFYTTDLVDVKDRQPDDSFRIYPVPAEGILHIECGQMKRGKGVILLRDISGRVVHSENVRSFAKGMKYSLPVSRMARGLYMMEIIMDTGERTVKKIILQ